MASPIYLDYNATTPCDERVVKTMLPYLTQTFGNPDSRTHWYGWKAQEAVEKARESIAHYLAVPNQTLFFNAGATEGINTALRGLAVLKQRSNKLPVRNHIITGATEHKATLNVCSYLATIGFDLTILPVNSQGALDLQKLQDSIRPNTLFVSLMAANNETGVLHPLSEIASIVKKNRIHWICDTTQALGKISLPNLIELGIDMAVFSAHKVYGPKGVGVLYIREGNKADILPPFMIGGGQERGYRSGTVNVAGTVGFAKAVAIACATSTLNTEQNRLQSLLNRLENKILSTVEAATCNGQNTQRLPNTTNISFDYVDGETLLRSLSKDLAVSNGSACNSVGVMSSYVLEAMGVNKNLAAASLRLSIGRFSTTDEIDKSAQVIAKTVARLRNENILWKRRIQ